MKDKIDNILKLSKTYQTCIRYILKTLNSRRAAEREAIEENMKYGSIRWVVCTSSLDLGIDFQPVEKVVFKSVRREQMAAVHAGQWGVSDPVRQRVNSVTTQ